MEIRCAHERTIGLFSTREMSLLQTPNMQLFSLKSLMTTTRSITPNFVLRPSISIGTLLCLIVSACNHDIEDSQNDLPEIVKVLPKPKDGLRVVEPSVNVVVVAIDPNNDPIIFYWILAGDLLEDGVTTTTTDNGIRSEFKLDYRSNIEGYLHCSIDDGHNTPVMLEWELIDGAL